jgi:hypothetical protein
VSTAELSLSASGETALGRGPNAARDVLAEIDSLKLGASDMARAARWAALLAEINADTVDGDAEEALATGVVLAYARPFAEAMETAHSMRTNGHRLIHARHACTRR